MAFSRGAAATITVLLSVLDEHFPGAATILYMCKCAKPRAIKTLRFFIKLLCVLFCRGAAATTTALLTVLDVHLPVAAANLLYTCACTSPFARAWLLDQSRQKSTYDSHGNNNFGAL